MTLYAAVGKQKDELSLRGYLFSRLSSQHTVSLTWK